jgi:hypothetical protein
MPQALPQQLRYGSIPPGIAQSQRFTGAVAQRQPVSQIVPPPDFIAPYYANLGLTPPRPIAAQQTAPAPLGSRLGSLLGPPGARPPGAQPPGPGSTLTPQQQFQRAASFGAANPQVTSGQYERAVSAGTSNPTLASSGAAKVGITPYNDVAAMLARGKRGVYQY